MNNISINNKKYTIIENYKSCFNKEEFEKYYTDFFYEYDYILGDYSYNKLRLKGFYDSKSKKVKEYNDIKNVKKYLEKYCAFECAYFLIKKEDKAK